MIGVDELNAMEIGMLADYCEAHQASVLIEDGKITDFDE